MARLKMAAAGLLAAIGAGQASAINIVVDYTYDTNNFFATQESRDAMQAVADRFSGVITSELDAVAAGTWRVGFNHPGTGAGWQLSTAANVGSDPLVGSGAAAANVYGSAGLNANEWTLFAGGRSLSPAGVGGTGTGSNFTSTYEDPNGPHHRGLIPVTPGDGVGDLPTWGGAIAFDTGRDWDFSLDSAGGDGTDFYSIALHEVGHALGLSTGWNQWEKDISGGAYSGPNALAAYNADNGTSLTELELAAIAAGFPHWEDGSYESIIFALANPNYNGTVGAGNLQDLLMEPTANFVGGSIERFELTNTDVGALQDVGWSVVPEPTSLTLLAMGGLFVARRRRAC